MIVSDNKPLLVALLQNHAIVFIERVFNEHQISILNLNMPNYKWDDADDPTMNN